MDRDAFEEHAEAGGFLEWVEYRDNLYGTPLPDDDAGDTILVIEVKGAAKVLDEVPGARMVLVVPPSLESLAERMRARGDDEAHVTGRVEAAARELEEGRRLAHHVVVNDDLDRVVDELAGILDRYRR